MASLQTVLLQASVMTGAPAASAAAAAGEKEEEGKQGEGEESNKAQPKGGAWWQWLLVGIPPSFMQQCCALEAALQKIVLLGNCSRQYRLQLTSCLAYLSGSGCH